MGFGCTAVSPPAKIRVIFVGVDGFWDVFFCNFLVADLLGNILANLLGDRLALLSWLLPRNVAAVLHLLGDNTHLLEVFFVCAFVFLFLCFCFCVFAFVFVSTSFWRGTCLHSVDSTCLATWTMTMLKIFFFCNLDNDNVDNLFFCNLDNQSPHNSRNCSHERDLESCFDINRKFLQNCIHNSCQNRDTESCFDITCFECELELGIEM